MIKLREPRKIMTPAPVDDSPVSDPIVKRQLGWFLIIGLAFELSLIFYTRSLQKMYKFNFFTEGTFFTWFSGIQLVAVGLVSFVNAYLARDVLEKKKAAAWASAGLLAFFLSVDELFAVHERIAPFSGRLFAAIELTWLKSSFWDIPVFIAYGLTAIIIWRYLRQDLNSCRVTKHLLLIGFVLMAISLSLDIFGSRLVLVVWEDSFKLIGFFFFLTAFTGSLLLKVRIRAT